MATVDHLAAGRLGAGLVVPADYCRWSGERNGQLGYLGSAITAAMAASRGHRAFHPARHQRSCPGGGPAVPLTAACCGHHGMDSHSGWARLVPADQPPRQWLIGINPALSAVHRQQVFHLVFGEAEMDKKGPDLGHGADRDGHFPAAPDVPLLEEHVGYTVAARFHDQPLDLPYLAVGRTDGQFSAYVYLAGWDVVDGDPGTGIAMIMHGT